MADPSPEERAAAERRKVLTEFGITEPDLSSLKALDPEEAAWRIEHEHKMMMAFLEERKQFLITECITVKLMLDKKPPKDRQVVLAHNDAIGHNKNYPKGSKVG